MKILTAVIVLVMTFSGFCGEWTEKFYPGLEAAGNVTFDPKGYRGETEAIVLRYLHGARIFGVAKDVRTDLSGTVEWTVRAEISTESNGECGAAMEFFDATGKSLGVKSGKGYSAGRWQSAVWRFTSPRKAVRSSVHLLSLGSGIVRFANVRVDSAQGVDQDEMPIDVHALPPVWNKDWNGGREDMVNFSDAPIPVSFLLLGDRSEAKDTALEIMIPEALELKYAFSPNARLYGIEKPSLIRPGELAGVKGQLHRFTNLRGVAGNLQTYPDYDRLFGIAAVIGPKGDGRQFEGTYPIVYRVVNGGQDGLVRRFDMIFRPMPTGLKRSRKFLCFSWNNQDRYFPVEKLETAMKPFAAAGLLSFRRGSHGCFDFPDGRVIGRALAEAYPETIFSVSMPNFWYPSKCRLTEAMKREMGFRLVKTIDTAHAHAGLVCPQFYTTNRQFLGHLRTVVNDILRESGVKDGDWVTLDQEPWECQTYCFCDECLKAFAEFHHLDHMPTITEAGADPDKWADFRTMQSMHSLRLLAEMIRDYNPKLKVVDYDYILDYGNLAAERNFRRQCAKDSLKNEKWLAGHLASYYHTVGLAAFMAMKNNVRHLAKSYYPMTGMCGYGDYLRPGEVLTPRQFRQFALAAFVNGCPGWAVYSGTCYDGRHLEWMMKAEDEVARYEHLPWGRADGTARPVSASDQFASASVIGPDGNETVALFNFDCYSDIDVKLDDNSYRLGPNDVKFVTREGRR